MNEHEKGCDETAEGSRGCGASRVILILVAGGCRGGPRDQTKAITSRVTSRVHSAHFTTTMSINLRKRPGTTAVRVKLGDKWRLRDLKSFIEAPESRIYLGSDATAISMTLVLKDNFPLIAEMDLYMGVCQYHLGFCLANRNSYRRPVGHNRSNSLGVWRQTGGDLAHVRHGS